MLAVHIPSKQEAQVLGYHHGRQAHLVKLENGEQQLWTKDSTQIHGKTDMTSKILMTISGSKGKTWHMVERIFNTVEDAAEYLTELTRFDPITEYDKKGQCVGMSNGWSISCNYDVREIMKKKAPTHDLWDWYPFDMQKKLSKPQLKRMPSNDYRKDEPSIAPVKKQHTGKMVKLQDLTSDTRKARVVLRDLVRRKKITKPGRWEWPEGSADIEVVKEALKKA